MSTNIPVSTIPASNTATTNFVPYNKSDFLFASIPSSYMKMNCDQTTCYNEECAGITIDYPGNDCHTTNNCIKEYKKQACVNKIAYNNLVASQIQDVGTSSGRYNDLYNMYNQDISQMISNVICIGILIGAINFV